MSTIIVLFALALATQILAWIFRAKDPVKEFVGPQRSDYTLQDFELHSLDTHGKLTFTVVAPRLSRRGDDGSIFVDAPNYRLVDNSDNLWLGTSESAWVNKDGSKMLLQGVVDMHREPTPKAPPARIVTSDLTVWPKDKKSETAALATITQPDSILHGVGMKADLNLKVLELLADVHATLQPKSTNAQKSH